MRWNGIKICVFWSKGDVFAHLFVDFQGLIKVFAGIDTNGTVTCKVLGNRDFLDLFMFKWTTRHLLLS